MISPLTPLDFLARSVHAWRDLTAVVEGDRRFTYAEFGARVERQAAALLALGVQPGDRVAVLAPNGAMALEAHFAPMRIGAILVMLNTRLAPAELEWILHSNLWLPTPLFPRSSKVGQALSPANLATCPTSSTTTRVSWVARGHAPPRLRWPTKTPASPSTTLPAPPASPKASCSATAAPGPTPSAKSPSTG